MMKTMHPIPADNEFAIVNDSDRSLKPAPNTLGIRIGAVSYLNSKPLLRGLSSALQPRDHLSLAVPSRLASALHTGQLDIGLIPVVEYFSNPSYRVVSNAAIACNGPVWSVRLFFRGDPKSVQSIAMDEGSRTSVALTKVLFQHRFGFVPQSADLPLHADPCLSDADAVLVIGDRAMKPERYRSRFAQDWDLGQAWYEETGLPFVFAMWVARDDQFASGSIALLLERIRDIGCAQIDDIASAEAAAYGLSIDQCKDYLNHFIRFRLGEREQLGLDEFRKKCVTL